MPRQSYKRFECLTSQDRYQGCLENRTNGTQHEHGNEGTKDTAILVMW